MAASIWKGYLSFGLVSFPIRLSIAARRSPVRFHMLHKTDLSGIKEVWYCVRENKPVTRADIVKGYEYGKDEYVVVEDEEIKKIAPPTAHTIEILQFVRASEIDPLFFDKSYYVNPEETVNKPYSLFLRVLTETKYDAVAKVAMHGREHVAIIRPARDGIVLHTMYYASELRKPLASWKSESGTITQKEMELAKKLVETLAAPFKPEQYTDQYRENLERLIEQKQNGEKPTTLKQPKHAPVVDILEALKESLASKKPPAKASPKKRGRGRTAA